MIPGTLSRYFGMRFLSAVLAVFAGLFVLVLMIDFIELLRRTGDIKDVSALRHRADLVLPGAATSPSASCRSRCWSARWSAT